MKRLALQLWCRLPKPVGVVPLLAVVFVAVLVMTVWVARGASLRDGWGSIVETRLTATPTRTPRPSTPEPTVAPVDLVIVAPNNAPDPTASLLVSRQEVTPAPLPTRLAEVVAEYGMDPTRRFVVVDLDAQTMYVWEPGQPIRTMLVSTGDEARGYRTPAWYGLVGKYWGTFQAFDVYADDGWYLFEDAGSILIHGAPYKLIDGQKVYQDLDALGTYPASRGCIRLDPDDARWFTQWGPEGVPLVILPRTDNGIEG